MLEKFKLFGSKDKGSSGPKSPSRPSLPKSSTRASNSSSGFSSAKSETSESAIGPNPSLKSKDSVKETSMGISSPKAALKSLTKKAIKTPKTPTKSGWKSANEEKLVQDNKVKDKVIVSS